MSHDLKCVKLWVREEGHGSPRRLLNTITSTSKFRTMPWFNKLDNTTDDDLIRAAKEQRNGWRHNGPWPNAVFEIEAHPRMILSDTLIDALQATSNQIAGDAGTSDPEEVAELCVDASRMEFYGHKEAQEEASDLIKEFGYDEFLKEAAKHVYC